MRRYRLTIPLLFLALLAGCGDDDPVVVNVPPETRITVAPAPGAVVRYDLGQLGWTGFDPDGPVVAFDWAVTANGRDGASGPTHPDSIPWQRTERGLLEGITVSADLDSFPPDVENPLITDPGGLRWWQTHTLWVRSVDGQGAVDATPDTVSFVAWTESPRARVDLPAVPAADACIPVNSTVAVGVETDDPDGPLGVASAYRWALVAVEDLDPAAYAAAGLSVPSPGTCFDRDQADLLDVGHWVTDLQWSEWIDFVVTEDPQVDVVLPALEAGRSWWLVLQARDAAGALSPVWRWGESLLHLRADGGFTPRLTVDDPTGTERDFSGPATGAVDLGLLEGDLVAFAWRADAADYLGLVAGYRYAWDPSDPLDVQEGEWIVPLGQVQQVETALAPGAHSLVVEVRDNSGAVTRAAYRFQVP